jgi:ABC-type transporter MlaC component
MKNFLLALVTSLLMVVSLAYAQKVKDTSDLEKVHEHVQEAIQELNNARAANHYDMAGHGGKAEELLHQAEHELRLAIDSAKASK